MSHKLSIYATPPRTSDSLAGYTRSGYKDWSPNLGQLRDPLASLQTKSDKQDNLIFPFFPNPNSYATEN